MTSKCPRCHKDELAYEDANNHRCQHCGQQVPNAEVRR